MSESHAVPTPADSSRRSIATSTWRDSTIVAALTVASLLLSAHFQLAEAFYASTRRWESLQLDELSTGLLVLAMGLIWLSWRRNRLARRELRARAAAEAALAAALNDNRRLAQEHVRIQEAERKHLARELHDQLGQYLNAIKLDAVSIAQAGAPGALDAAVVQRAAAAVIDSVDHVYGAVTDMIRRLRPVGLDELGLAAAIEHCVDQWRVRLPGTTFELSVSGDFEGLPEPLALTAYRMVQEGLTNVYRHAAAGRVDIRLAREHPAAMLLTVADDGRGMQPDERTAGFGLSGMRERVEMAGGSFVLSSAPGRGLTLTARLPVLECAA